MRRRMVQVLSIWQRESEHIEKSELVLVAEHQWITARVIGTNTGANGRIRVAVVRTSCGAVFKRAIHKLAMLPEAVG